ncbi:MAG: rod-binding protein [Rhodobacterales bacterium]
MLPTLSVLPLSSVAIPPPRPESDPLLRAAQQLEAGFLAEFLKSTGFGKTSESFGGGIGEDQFASFLLQAQADSMVKSGGIGLAEAIYHSLKERQNDG